MPLEKATQNLAIFHNCDQFLEVYQLEKPIFFGWGKI